MKKAVPKVLLGPEGMAFSSGGVLALTTLRTQQPLYAQCAPRFDSNGHSRPYLAHFGAKSTQNEQIGALVSVTYFKWPFFNE
ncbi:hypothetical protein J2X61_006083 [Bacillus sp. 3255]|nr:hypothetical protein [Bacillus sp. 3255]